MQTWFKPLALRKAGPLLFYFPLALIFALILWTASWDQPLKELFYIPTFFQENTKNMEVLYFGTWKCSTVSIPWHYPLRYLGIVTPLPVLIFAVIGLFTLLAGVWKRKPYASLILLWFFVPISRFILPKMGVLDGIRHFLEVVYPLSVMGAVGVMTCLDGIKRIPFISGKFHKILFPLLSFILISYLILINIRYHPYQIAYFNELAGGIKGAFGKFDLDYWGSSQKKAIEWVNANVPKDSTVAIIMAGDVAAKYLRPDLLAKVNSKERDNADYVVLLNRQSFFYRYFYTWEYLLRKKPVYTVELQGVPLVWVYDNHLPSVPRQKEWWHGEDPCMRKYWVSPVP